MLIIACSPAKQVSKTSATLAQVSQDSTEYELIVTDIRFDPWYQLNYSEAKDRTEEYYRSKNIIAVVNWNEYYRLGKYINVIDSEINYQPGVDYGMELNRKLYWYFRFVQEEYGVKVL